MTLNWFLHNASSLRPAIFDYYIIFLKNKLIIEWPLTFSGSFLLFFYFLNKETYVYIFIVFEIASLFFNLNVSFLVKKTYKS